MKFNASDVNESAHFPTQHAHGKAVTPSRLPFKTWPRSYKNIFSIELRYTGIKAFWLADGCRLTSIDQSEGPNLSVA